MYEFFGVVGLRIWVNDFVGLFVYGEQCWFEIV